MNNNVNKNIQRLYSFDQRLYSFDHNIDGNVIVEYENPFIIGRKNVDK